MQDRQAVDRISSPMMTMLMHTCLLYTSSGKEQDIKVIIASKEYKFHVVNKAKKNMMEDDGFDD